MHSLFKSSIAAIGEKKRQRAITSYMKLMMRRVWDFDFILEISLALRRRQMDVLHHIQGHPSIFGLQESKR